MAYSCHCANMQASDGRILSPLTARIVSVIESSQIRGLLSESSNKNGVSDVGSIRSAQIHSNV